MADGSGRRGAESCQSGAGSDGDRKVSKSGNLATINLNNDVNFCPIIQHD